MANPGQHRSPVNGRFIKVDTSNTQISASGKFETQRELDIAIQGADPADSAYTMVRDDKNVVQRPVTPRVQDDLGVKGSPLRRRNPTLVDATEDARTEYYSNGRDVEQGAVLRTSAKAGHDGTIPGTEVCESPLRYLTGGDRG